MAEAHEIGCGCVLAPILVPVAFFYFVIIVPLRFILAIPMAMALWLMNGRVDWDDIREFVIGELDEMLDGLFKKKP